jgi:hypothetical protein
MTATDIGEKAARWEGAILLTRRPRSSEGMDEGPRTGGFRSEEKFRCLYVNSNCTGRPQLFHSAPAGAQLDVVGELPLPLDLHAQ